jgi:hypothetical protein
LEELANGGRPTEQEIIYLGRHLRRPDGTLYQTEALMDIYDRDFPNNHTEASLLRMELNALVYNQCTLALRDNPNDQAFCIYVYNSQTVERLTQTPYLDAIKLDARRLGYSTVCIYEWATRNRTAFEQNP